MKIYLAHWYDFKDQMLRVAGAYLRRKSAEARVKELGSGGVQGLTIGKPCRFTHESKSDSPNESERSKAR